MDDFTLKLKWKKSMFIWRRTSEINCELFL